MFGLKPPFYTSEEYSMQTLDLLKDTTLGSNGAKYRHRGVEKRIGKLYHPLFLNLSIRKRVLSNVTFCRRDKDWYIRYFAFNRFFQSAPQQKKSSTSSSTQLKNELAAFFENALIADDGPDTFYAYIDPRNERSLRMSQFFGLNPVAEIATQTFSRIKPKKTSVECIKNKEEIASLVTSRFDTYAFFHPYQTYQTEDSNFWVLKEKGEISAFAKSYSAEWQIERLPGKNGALLTKLIPYIPVLRKVIRPNAHTFAVIDSVWVKNNDSQRFKTLAEGILYAENKNVMHWWVDKKEPLWNDIEDKTNWGLLHKINGVHDVALVARSNKPISLKQSAYVSGFDFI
jgi:hypothetical protein